jgi:hypothetical protein
MYYVIRKGEQDLTYYHEPMPSKFHDQTPARAYAENLKSYHGHNYDVIKVETVWTTQTLDEAMRGK